MNLEALIEKTEQPPPSYGRLPVPHPARKKAKLETKEEAKREPKKKEETLDEIESVEPLYEIESIVGTASDRTGHRCYIVKWRGYTETSLELVSRVHHVEAFAPALEAYRWKQRHDTDTI